jgi:hypothetical protein
MDEDHMGDPAPLPYEPRAWLQRDRRRGFNRAPARVTTSISLKSSWMASFAAHFGALSKGFRDLCILAIIICAAWVFQAFAGRTDTLMSSRRTLRRLVSELADRGVKVSYRTVWNFVHREKVSYKKSVFPAELLAAIPSKFLEDRVSWSALAPVSIGSIGRHRRAGTTICRI